MRHIKLCMLMIAALIAVSACAVSAATLSWQGYDWETQPLAPYVSGNVAVGGTTPSDYLSMPAPTGSGKTSWLPYGGTYAEKMAIAQVAMNGATAATVHAKVYDPQTTGKSGWAVILKDSNGKILDFGIRGFYAAAQIIPHQYDGAAWTNTPSSSRTRTGNNYYTLDFELLSSGAIQYTLNAYENGTMWDYTNTTTVTYADIAQIYLATATPDTTGAANYKWTEFNYTAVPEPSSIFALASGLVGMAGFAVRRRK